MSNNLCPCPKCKSDNAQAVFKRKRMNSIVLNVSYIDYGVRCDDCGYEMRGYMTEKQAVRMWNLKSAKTWRKSEATDDRERSNKKH